MADNKGEPQQLTKYKQNIDKSCIDNADNTSVPMIQPA